MAIEITSTGINIGSGTFADNPNADGVRFTEGSITSLLSLVPNGQRQNTGYIMGGENPNHPGITTDAIQKFPFSAEPSPISSVASLSLNNPSVRHPKTGFRSDTAGYYLHGLDSQGDKFPFATEVVTSSAVTTSPTPLFLPVNTGTSATTGATFNSTTHGVVGIGQPTPNKGGFIQKWSFATDGAGTIVGEFYENSTPAIGDPQQFFYDGPQIGEYKGGFQNSEYAYQKYFNQPQTIKFPFANEQELSEAPNFGGNPFKLNHMANGPDYAMGVASLPSFHHVVWKYPFASETAVQWAFIAGPSIPNPGRDPTIPAFIGTGSPFNPQAQPQSIASGSSSGTEKGFFFGGNVFAPSTRQNNDLASFPWASQSEYKSIGFLASGLDGYNKSGIET